MLTPAHEQPDLLLGSAWWTWLVFMLFLSP